MQTLSSKPILPEHFGWRPEKPKYSDALESDCKHCFYCQEAEQNDNSICDSCAIRIDKEIAEWNAKYGAKPEPDWKRFKEDDPIDGVNPSDREMIWCKDIDSDQEHWRQYVSDKREFFKGRLWMSQDDNHSHYLKEKTWNYHQTKFPGFEMLKTDNGICFKKGDIYVEFFNSGPFVLNVKDKIQLTTCDIDPKLSLITELIEEN